jgi:hypothetical protein
MEGLEWNRYSYFILVTFFMFFKKGRKISWKRHFSFWQSLVVTMHLSWSLPFVPWEQETKVKRQKNTIIRDDTVSFSGVITERNGKEQKCRSKTVGLVDVNFLLKCHIVYEEATKMNWRYHPGWKICHIMSFFVWKVGMNWLKEERRSEASQDFPSLNIQFGTDIIHLHRIWGTE